MKRCVIVFAHCVTWTGGAVIVNFISQWFYYRSGRYHPHIWIERMGWLRFFSCKITQRVKGNIEKSCAWGFNSIYWTHIKSFSIIMRSCISVTAWRDVYIFWCLFDGFYESLIGLLLAYCFSFFGSYFFIQWLHPTKSSRILDTDPRAYIR